MSNNNHAGSTARVAIPDSGRVVTYDDIRLSKKTRTTLTSAEQERYVEDVFCYYRQTGFPYYCLNRAEKERELRNLFRFDCGSLIKNEIIHQSMHALNVAWSYHHHSWNVRCGRMRTPYEVFFNDDLFRCAISKVIGDGRNMSDASIRRVIRSVSGAQGVSNFRPSAAAAIYDYLLPEKGGVVWDPSGGFGGRLLGALACPKVTRYVATDPCSETFAGLQQMRAELVPMAEPLGRERLEVELHKMGSEDFVPERDSLSACFTSPPYGATERYSDEPTQSYLKYPSNAKWMNEFMRKTLENCHYGLKPDGLLAINIANVKTYKTLENDFLAMAEATGFRLVRTLRLALSPIPGTRKSGQKFKFEPVFVFRKG